MSLRGKLVLTTDGNRVWVVLSEKPFCNPWIRSGRPVVRVTFHDTDRLHQEHLEFLKETGRKERRGFTHLPTEDWYGNPGFKVVESIPDECFRGKRSPHVRPPSPPAASGKRQLSPFKVSVLLSERGHRSTRSK